MTRSETGQMEGFRPPREDINSPDLYIPGNARDDTACFMVFLIQFLYSHGYCDIHFTLWTCRRITRIVSIKYQVSRISH